LIDLNSLPKEVRDRLELKEELDVTFSRSLEEDYTDIMFQTLDDRRKKNVEKNYLASIFGQQGSSKSYCGLFVCGYLNSDFNVENIFFDYNKLVNERYKLKPHTAVLVDEQTSLYGVDSMRISIILNALKEQLRKRSVHMIYCSPTLKEEYKTSNYVMETMFIDYEMKESYISYKTNELKCLGYVVIPHPLSVISKKLLLDYEKLKDEHLDRLVSQPIDDVEERAKSICNDKFFKTAEKVYIDKIGFIPYRTLIQIVNKMFPEFKGSVIVFEVCDRIRLNKELSVSGYGATWEISGKSWQKKKMDSEDKRDSKNIPKDDVVDDDFVVPKSDHLKVLEKKFGKGDVKSKKQRVIRK
jgi:hypothetical protein